MYPCPNEDHTATNIPHTNLLRHLITKLRVNHGVGDCKTFRLPTSTHRPSSFPCLFELTARTLGSIATHTCMQQWRVWSPSCTNDDVEQQSQTHRAGWLQSLSLLVSLFLQTVILFLLCSHSSSIPFWFFSSFSVFSFPFPSTTLLYFLFSSASLSPHF